MPVGIVASFRLIGGLLSLIASAVQWISNRITGKKVSANAPILPTQIPQIPNKAPPVRTFTPYTEFHRRPSSETLPYDRCEGLLTEGELGLWEPLHLAVDDRYLVFCKVRLADVIRARGSRWQERKWFSKIGWFHIDFVLCERKSTAPLLVIELDDRTHQRRRQKKRDEFKDAALRGAGLPILRIPAQRDYDVVYLQKRIAETVLRPKRA